MVSRRGGLAGSARCVGGVGSGGRCLLHPGAGDRWGRDARAAALAAAAATQPTAPAAPTPRAPSASALAALAATLATAELGGSTRGGAAAAWVAPTCRRPLRAGRAALLGLHRLICRRWRRRARGAACNRRERPPSLLASRLVGGRRALVVSYPALSKPCRIQNTETRCVVVYAQSESICFITEFSETSTVICRRRSGPDLAATPERWPNGAHISSRVLYTHTSHHRYRMQACVDMT